LLLRGTRDGKTNDIIHKLCDNKGSLLILIKTLKGILCGAFCSISWKNSGDWTVDKKAFLYSLKLKKIYKPLKDNHNLLFGSSYGLWIGYDGNIAVHDGKLYSRCYSDPF
jgi:hypothetical protein